MRLGYFSINLILFIRDQFLHQLIVSVILKLAYKWYYRMTEKICIENYKLFMQVTLREIKYSQHIYQSKFQYPEIFYF